MNTSTVTNPADIGHRTTLAERAKQRRQAIGLDLSSLSHLTQCPQSTLLRWEKCLPAHPESGIERVWEKALHVPRGWLRDASLGARDVRGQDQSTRESLGRRARLRRYELCLRLTALAQAIGVKRTVLQKWEECLPLVQDEALERRWEEQLEVPAGWLRDARAVTAEPETTVAAPPALPRFPDVEAEMLAYINWFAEDPRLARSFDARRLSATGKRAAAVVGAYYGLDGTHYDTKADIARKYGEPYSVVNSLLERKPRQMRAQPFYMPNLQKLAQEVRNSMPCTVETIEQRFGKLIGHAVSFSDVCRFAADILQMDLYPGRVRASVRLDRTAFGRRQAGHAGGTLHRH